MWKIPIPCPPHCYEARYDEGGPITLNVNGAIAADDLMRLVSASKPRTYVYDICVQCGSVVKRERA